MVWTILIIIYFSGVCWLCYKKYKHENRNKVTSNSNLILSGRDYRNSYNRKTMNAYIFPKVAKIQELQKNQILFYDTTEEMYEVVEIGEIYALLRPIAKKLLNGLQVKEIYVSNEFITNYFLLPRA